MKHLLLIILLLLIAGGCSSIKNRQNYTDDKLSYLIESIEKKENHYSIIAIQNGKRYKILSFFRTYRSDDSLYKEKIEPGKRFRILLKMHEDSILDTADKYIKYIDSEFPEYYTTYNFCENYCKPLGADEDTIMKIREHYTMILFVTAEERRYLDSVDREFEKEIMELENSRKTESREQNADSLTKN